MKNEGVVEVEVEVEVEDEIQRFVFCGECYWLLVIGSFVAKQHV